MFTVRLFLLAVACWLLVIGILALIAAMSQGDLVLRRRRLWQFIVEKEGINYAKNISYIVFVMSTFFINIIIAVIFLDIIDWRTN
jgi:hypothetical protein